jgi:rhamnosyl/mannosyltransferase
MEVALLRNLDILKKKIFIITWHANIENSRWKAIKVVYNPLINSLLEVCTKVVVTSPQLLENSKLLQGYAHKVEVIPLSFDPEITNFNVIKERKFPKNRKFKLLFIGRLREYKGVKYLIEAIKNLDVELTIVGDGEKELELRELVESFGISSKVAFFKNALNSEIAEYYQNSDLFILPSINEAEAFGIVQLEAMSNALPVINTNLNSGVPFVSLDRISGLTVEPANSEALEKAILEISSNEGFYEELSINSLERSKSFTRSKMANSYLKLYKNNTN